MRSPHPWGLTGIQILGGTLEEAFPTPVGINRRETPMRRIEQCVPHTRGD